MPKPLHHVLSARLFALAISVGAVGACESKSTPEQSNPGACTGECVEADIGPEGGVLTSHDGSVTLEIPAGALAQAVQLRISPAANAPAGSLVQAYAIEPSGTVFAKPAVLAFTGPTITHTETGMPRVAVAEGGGWRTLSGGSYVPDATGVTGHLLHLSTYGVVEAEPEAAGQPACSCVPDKRQMCCDKANGTYLAPCTCAWTVFSAMEEDGAWTDLDCLIQEGLFTPSAHGKCALDCCRSLPGKLMASDGSSVVCQYSTPSFKSFDVCVSKCPAWEEPPCKGGGTGGSGGAAGAGGSGGTGTGGTGGASGGTGGTGGASGGTGGTSGGSGGTGGSACACDVDPICQNGCACDPQCSPCAGALGCSVVGAACPMLDGQCGVGFSSGVCAPAKLPAGCLSCQCPP